MTKFISICHNSFNIEGLSWIQIILSGLRDGQTCTMCAINLDYTSGDLQVPLEMRKAEFRLNVLERGARLDDIDATYDKQHSAVWPHVILKDIANFRFTPTHLSSKPRNR
ncbi:MAG: hypothetical protein DWQ01_07655 [Planctomycetota bacterium]|nr:MAG: hypothetical protein DWQ01_07655 [Planctomycetota bacterium]